MATNDRSTVVGVFQTRSDAEKAVRALHDAGWHDDQIGIASQDSKGTSTTTMAHEDDAAGGAATGAVLGGLLGAAAALLIPGIGPVVAGGILATALGGAAVGAAAGGILGALVGLGVPEEEARYYEGEFKSGRTLVTVKAGNRYQDAWNILRRYGAYDMQNRGSAATSSATMGSGATTASTTMGSTTPSSTYNRSASTVDNTAYNTRTQATNERPLREGEEKLRLHEEQLTANKERVQAGEVRLGKEVVEEQKTINVPVTHEEVYIERHPVNREVTNEAIGAHSETISVPVMDERVNVQKQTVVTEEVGIGKRAVTENKQVSDTVRREELKVHKEGDVESRSAMTDEETRRRM